MVPTHTQEKTSMSRRYAVREVIMEERVASAPLATPALVAEYAGPLMSHLLQEELHVLLLDTKNRLIRDHMSTVGLLDRAQAHPREVFRAAIVHAAARVILLHNHPSGDPTPSQPDINMTRELVSAGQVVGIEVVDHVIIGKGFTSFRESGLM